LGTELLSTAEFVRQLAIRYGGQLLADFVDVRRDLGHDLQVAALTLPRRRVVLLAELYFLLFGDELDLALLRHRIDAATREHARDQQ
jgi:hypothetical protein